MQHIYKHKFENGLKVTLTVEFSDENILFYSEPAEIPPECEREYLIWRNQVVAPDILSHLTDEQAEALATLGAEILNDTLDSHEEIPEQDQK